MSTLMSGITKIFGLHAKIVIYWFLAEASSLVFFNCMAHFSLHHLCFIASQHQVTETLTGSFPTLFTALKHGFPLNFLSAHTSAKRGFKKKGKRLYLMITFP